MLSWSGILPAETVAWRAAERGDSYRLISVRLEPGWHSFRATLFPGESRSRYWKKSSPARGKSLLALDSVARTPVIEVYGVSIDGSGSTR